MKLRHLALSQGNDSGIGKTDLLVEAGNVLHVAREPVEAFGHHYIELAVTQPARQTLEIGADVGGAGDGAIGECGDDRPALAISPGPAGPDLVVDRGIALEIGTVASI
jgi:hypothetical protein